MWYLLIGLGAGVIVVLSVIAVKLQLKVRDQAKARAEQAAEQLKQTKERREYARKSISILAQAMLKEELTLTEASIRIGAMIQIFPLTQEQQAEHRCFVELAKATSHIPILEEWKKLPKAKKRELNAERERLEENYKDFVMAACKSIADNPAYLREYIDG